MLIFVLCSVLGIQAQGTIAIPYFQDFASLTTGGINNSTNSSIAVATMPDGITAISEGYQAGGVLKLGSGTTAGSLTTGTFTPVGTDKVRVAFRAVPWAAATPQGAKIRVTYGAQVDTISIAPATHTFPLTATDFVQYQAIFEPEATASAVTISTIAETGIEASCFIDDFKVSMLALGGMFYEGFESTAFPPEGWTAINVRGSKQWKRATDRVIGIGSACVEYVSGGHENWLITPMLQPATGQSLSFYVNGQNYENTKLKVRVSTTSADTASFTTTLATYETGTSDIPSNSYTKKTLNLSQFVGQHIYIAFQVQDEYGSHVWIDSVSGVNLPSVACTAPENLSFSEIAQTTALVSWDELAYATSWVVEYSRNADFSNATSIVSSDLSYTLTGLEPGKKYYVRVKSDCQGGDYSQYLMGSFVTACNLLDPLNWTESFANEGVVPGVPDCWENIISCNNSPKISQTEVQDNIGGSLYIMSQKNNYNCYNGTMIVSPEFSGDFTGSEMTLWVYLTDAWRFDDYNDAQVLVGVMASPTDTATFEMVADITPDFPAQEETWIKKRVNFSQVDDTKRFIAIKVLNTSSSPYDGAEVYIDNIDLHPLPTCPIPVGLAKSANTPANRSEEFTWTAGSDETAWEFQYKENTDTAWTSINVNTNPVCTVSNLRFSTAYNVRLRAVCSETDMSDWITYNFTSGCYSLNLGWTENFDLADTTNIAPTTCWTKKDSYSVYPIILTDNGDKTPNALYFAFPASDKQRQGMVTPPFVEELATAQLDFSLRGVDINNGSMFVVGVMQDVANEATYMPLDTIIPTDTDWHTYRVKLNNVPTGYHHLAFTVYGDNSYTGSYPAYMLDDISVKVAPACPSPYSVQFQDVKDNSAKFTWSAGGTETTWTAEYKVATADTWSTATVDATTRTATLTGLQAATVYDVRVKAGCDSEYATASFTTDCAGITSLNENFDSFEQNEYPSCWKRVSNYAFAPLVSKESGIATKALKLDGSKPLYAITPKFSVPLSTRQLEFKTCRRGAQSGKLVVGVMSDPSDAATFMALDTIEPNVADEVYVRKQYVLNNVTDEYRYIAFRYGDVGETAVSRLDYYYLIDDIVVDTIPACISPSELLEYASTESSITVGISTQAPQTSWEYVYTSDMTVTSPDGLTTHTTTDNPFTISGLTVNTAYKVWVRTVCGTNEFSLWSEPIILRTACGLINYGFLEDFEDETPGSGVIPSCWYKISSNSSYPQVRSATTYGDGPTQSLRFNGVKPIYLITPATAGPLANYQLSFKLKREGTSSGKFQVGVMSDPNDVNTFVALATYDQSRTNVFETMTLTFPSVVDNGSNRHIAFRYGDAEGATTSTSYYYWIDDVSFTQAPSCLPVSNLQNLTNDYDSLVIAFAASATQSNWQYFVTSNTALTTPDASLAVAITNDTVTIPGLAGNTAYKLWVRSDCGSGEFSDWTGPISFRTSCAAVTTPWVETFSDRNESDYSNAYCWTRVNDLATSNSTHYPYVDTRSWASRGTTTGGLRFSLSTSNGVQTIASPEIAGGLQGKEITFYLKGAEGTGGGVATMEIGVMSDPTVEATYTAIRDITPTIADQWITYDVLFDNTIPAGSNHIVFKASLTSGRFDFALDDIDLHVAPTCIRPGNVAVADNSLQSNEATITWTATPMQANNWRLEYRETTDTTWMFTTTQVNRVSLNGLEPNTTYVVRVKSICSATDESIWSDDFTFTTACAPATLPFSEDFSGNKMPPSDCWDIYEGQAHGVFLGNTLSVPSSLRWATTTSSTGLTGNHARINMYGTAIKHWLVTPELVIPQNSTAELNFRVALTKVNSAEPVDTLNKDDKFMVVVSTDRGASWQSYNATIWANDSNAVGNNRLNDISNTGETVNIDLTQYAGQNIRIAFYAESSRSNGDNHLHIDDISVTATPITPPTVETLAASDITNNSATLNKNVIQGDLPIEGSGFYWRKRDAESAFIISLDGNVTGLSSGTEYEFFAYAMVSGVEYRGDTLYFTTTGNAPTPPTVTTLAATNITHTSATLNKQVVQQDEAISEEGWKYETPDGNWYFSTDGNLTNLMPNTLYRFVAYAKTNNNINTYYGDTLSFSTLVHTPPTVVTMPYQNLQCQSVQLVKSVTAGSETIDREGWMYQRDGHPEWAEVESADGALSNLEPNITYHYFAYASTATFPMVTGDTLTFTTPECSGVELAESTVTIYPNPAKDEVSIVVDGLTTDATATIFDIQGKVVGRYIVAAATGRATVDVSTLTDGTYIVRIVSKDINRVERLIIKR